MHNIRTAYDVTYRVTYRDEECNRVEYVQLKTSTSLSFRTENSKLRAHYSNELQMTLKNSQFKLLKNSLAIK